MFIATNLLGRRVRFEEGAKLHRDVGSKTITISLAEDDEGEIVACWPERGELYVTVLFENALYTIRKLDHLRILDATSPTGRELADRLPNDDARRLELVRLGLAPMPDACFALNPERPSWACVLMKGHDGSHRSPFAAETWEDEVESSKRKAGAR